MRITLGRYIGRASSRLLIIASVRKRISLLLGVVAFFLAGSFVGAEASSVYFVSSAIDRAGDGSSAAPFRTIQKAANIVSPGDTVIVKAGVYTDTNGDDRIVGISRSGTSSNWITFRSETKWGAVLDCQNNKTSYGWVSSAGSAYIRIEDFEIKGCSQTGFHSNASGVHDIYYYGNKIHDIGRVCTSITNGRSAFFQGVGTDNFTYDSNIAYTIGRLHTDSTCGDPAHWYQHDHGVYIRGTNSTIENNIFYDLQSGWGVQLSPECSGIAIINNTFYGANPGRDGQIMLWGSGATIQNNIFANPSNYAIVCLSEGSSSVRNNLSSVGLIKTSGSDSCSAANFTTTNNMTTENPDLVDPSNDDFYLQPTSPAINAGLSTNAPLYDCGRNTRMGAPDIGAYEYVPTQIKY